MVTKYHYTREELMSRMKEQPTPDGLLERTDASTLRSESFENGRYTVALARDRTHMVFIRDDKGPVSCTNRTMKPGMIEEFLPFTGRTTYPLYRTEDSALLAIIHFPETD